MSGSGWEKELGGNRSKLEDIKSCQSLLKRAHESVCSLGKGKVYWLSSCGGGTVVLFL